MAAIPKNITKDIFKLYKKGNYLKAIKDLDELQKFPAYRGRAFYWKGISYSKLQKYKKAAQNFKKAEQFGGYPKDLFYEYGQALYGMNDLKGASKYFQKSVAKNYRVPFSLYYVAFSNQTLEDYDTAFKFYNLLENEPTASKKLKQGAKYQKGKIILDQVGERKDHKFLIKSKVIPQYSDAIKFSPKTAMGKDINRDIKDIKKKFDLYERMKNGAKIPDKKWSLRFNQIVEFDSNVYLQATDAAPVVQNKDSLILESQVFGKYKYPIRKKFYIKPELKFTWKKHTDRDTADIYKNDAYSILPAIRNSYEHKLFNKKSSFLFDLEYSYNERDVNSTKELVFDNRSWTLVFGEKFDLFPQGGTTVKVKRKEFLSNTLTSNSRTLTVNALQIFKLPGGKLLIGTVNMDFANSYNNKTNSTNAYLLRGDFSWSKIYEKYDFDASLAITFTDTRAQSTTRGLEKSFNPTFSLSRKFLNKLIEVQATYDLTSKYSRDKVNYDYTKHVFSVDLEASF